MARKPARPSKRAIKDAADRASARSKGAEPETPPTVMAPEVVTKDRDKAGRFLTGNRIWEARSTCGPKPKFKNGEELWEECVKYFEWNEANPLKEAKVFSYQGDITHVEVDKMRAMTIRGLCFFLQIREKTWIEWRSTRPDLSEVIEQVEQIIYSHKFAGAAADLFNANIIARDLGLSDKTKIVDETPNVMLGETDEIDQARRVAFALYGIVKKNQQKKLEVIDTVADEVTTE